jgi:hypothetical protein
MAGPRAVPVGFVFLPIRIAPALRLRIAPAEVGPDVRAAERGAVACAAAHRARIHFFLVL